MALLPKTNDPRPQQEDGSGPLEPPPSQFPRANPAAENDRIEIDEGNLPGSIGSDPDEPGDIIPIAAPGPGGLTGAEGPEGGTGLSQAFRKPDAQDLVPHVPPVRPDPPLPETTTLRRQELPKPGALHVLYLHQNPGEAVAFDAKFGPGAAARVLQKPIKPTPQQLKKVARSPINEEHVVGALDPSGKQDLPASLHSYVNQRSDLEAVQREEAASGSLVNAHKAGKIEGFDAEKELQEAETLLEAWNLKLAQSELMGQGRQIALRGVRAAEARLNVAQDLLKDKQSGELGARQGTPAARMMLAGVIAYQQEMVEDAEKALEDTRYAAGGGPSVAAAEQNIAQQKSLLFLLEEKAKDLGKTASLKDATEMGDLAREMARAVFGQLPGLLGKQLEWMVENARVIDARTGKETKGWGTGNETLGAAAKALQRWSEEVDRSIPQPTFKDGMFEIQSWRDFKFWAAKSLGQGLGSTVGFMLPGALIGPKVGGLVGLSMGQGEVIENIKREFAARGEELDQKRLNNYVNTYGTMVGLLDSASGLFMLRGITDVAKRKIAQGVLSTFAKKIGSGAGVEGLTEGLQEGFQALALEGARQNGLMPYLEQIPKERWAEYAKRVAESAVAGGMVGASFGALSGARQAYSNQIELERKERLRELHEEVLKNMIAEQRQVEGVSDQPPVPMENPATPVSENGRPIEVAEAVAPIEVPKEVRSGRAQDVISFIRDRGGISDPTGDLKAIGVPPSLINEQGMDPDDIRELLVESGYITDTMDGGLAQTTVEDVYDLLRRSASGERVVPITDQMAEQDARLASVEARQEEDAQILSDLAAQLRQDEMPYDLSDLEERRVTELVRSEGFDPFDAFERVALERYEETGGRGRVRAGPRVDTSIPFPLVTQREGRKGFSKPPAGNITPENIASFSDYLKRGGSLSRKAFRDIAQASGVQESEVADLLETALSDGLLKQDRRGRYRRNPERMMDSPEGLLSSSAKAQRMMIETRLRSGKPYAVSERRIEDTYYAIEPHDYLRPAGVDLGVASRIIPADGDGELEVDVEFRRPDGSHFVFRFPWRAVKGSNAVFIPEDFFQGTPPFIAHFNLVGSTQTDHFIGGVHRHEIVHALSLTQALGRDVFDRLFAHAENLRVLKMPIADYFAARGDGGQGAFPGQTIADAYIEAYYDYPDIKGALREEAIAHLMELHYLGAFTTEQMAPIADIIDAFESGELSGNLQGVVQPAEMMAALGPTSSTDTVLYRGEPVRAEGGLGHHYTRSFSRAKGFAGEGGKVYAIRVPMERMGELRPSRDRNNFIVPYDLRESREEVSSPQDMGMLFAFGGMVGAQNLDKAGESRPLQAMRLADEMKAAGADPIEIYKATRALLEGTPFAGVHHGVDGKPRFEISDDGMTFTPAEPKRKWLGMGNARESVKMSQKGVIGPYITHNLLAKAYPELANRRFNIKSGEFVVEDGGNARARVTASGPESKISDVVLHEIQHDIQILEGFETGANLGHAKGHSTYSPSTGFGAAIDRIAGWREDFQTYTRFAGEVEARNVERRSQMSAELRRHVAPWETQDTPYSEQISHISKIASRINRILQPFWSSRLSEWLPFEKAGSKAAHHRWIAANRIEEDIAKGVQRENLDIDDAVRVSKGLGAMIGHNSRMPDWEKDLRAKIMALEVKAFRSEIELEKIDRKRGVYTSAGEQSKQIRSELEQIRQELNAARNELVEGSKAPDGIDPEIWRAVQSDTRGQLLFALGGPVFDRQSAIDDLGFYSKAIEAARGLKQSKGTPEQMLSQLRKAGVKQSELDALGLEAAMRGDKSVAKEDIIEHLELARLDVREAKYTQGWTDDSEQRVAENAGYSSFEVMAKEYGLTIDEMRQEASETFGTPFPMERMGELRPSRDRNNFIVPYDLRESREEVSLPQDMGMLFAINAFHGSQHDFDRFDVSNLGAGEGTYWEGPGLYFTATRSVAEGYALANAYKTGGDETGASGRVYDVTIDVDEASLPHLDNETTFPASLVQDVKDLTGGTAYARDKKKGMTFRDLWRKAAKQAPDELRRIIDRHGLKALKYDDGKKQSYNYVVFDDSLVTITKKNGEPVSGQERNGVLFSIGAPVFERQFAIDDLGFYSKAIEAARGLKQSKGTPEQMLSQLKKAGVKQSEIEATGLEDYLDSFAANGTRYRAGNLPDEMSADWRLDGNLFYFDVLNKDGTKVGQIAGHRDDSGNAQILDTLLDADMQGRGIGLAMYQEFLATAQSNGVKHLYSSANDSIASRAVHRIWSKLGAQDLGADHAPNNHPLSGDQLSDVASRPEATVLAELSPLQRQFAKVESADEKAKLLEAIVPLQQELDAIAKSGGTAASGQGARYHINLDVVPQSVTRDGIVSFLELQRTPVMEARYENYGAMGAGEIPADLTIDDAKRTSTKWSEYSLDPSNPTYRETVLHLPEGYDPNGLGILQEQIIDRMTELEDQFGIEMENATPEGLAEHTALADELRAVQGHISRGEKSTFRQGHFSDVPNAISHLRTSIQPDAEGKSNFVINELQSDWGQKIRDSGGARDEAKIAELKARAEATEKEFNELAKSNREWAIAELRKTGYPEGLDEEWALKPRTSVKAVMRVVEKKNARLGKEVAGRITKQDELLQLANLHDAEYKTAESSAAGHPLVNTTDQWVNTSLRRALRQAIEANADYIAIASGETVDSFGMGAPLEGLKYAYNEMYPKKLRDIIKRIDKEAAKPETIERLIASDNESPLGQGFTRFPITDKLRSQVMLEGQPLFALAGRPLPDGQTRVPKPGLDAPKRGLSDLIVDLATALNIELPRSGRLNPGLKAQGARAQHNSATGISRLGVANDIEAFAHEAGHALEARFSLHDQELRRLMILHRAELEPMATPGRDLVSEGFAEFMRKYIVNPIVAEQQAPNFLEDFEDFLDRREPGLRDGLDQVIAGFQEWVDAPSAGVMKTHTRTAKKPGMWGKLFKDIRTKGFGDTAKAYFDTSYTALLDDLHPVKTAVQRLVEMAEENLRVNLGPNQRLGVTAAKDAYKLLRLARNSYQAGHIDLMQGVRGYQGTEHAGPSMRDVIQQVGEERLEDFNAYLTSRRMVQEWDRLSRGEIDHIPDAYSRADHIEAIKEFEASYPQFVDAATQLYDFQNRLLTKAYDAGFILEETYNDLIQREDYVPVHRHMDDDDGGTPAGQIAKNNKTKQVKRFKGSTRDVVSPLESISRYTYELNFAIARNDAIKALDALARAAGPGGGSIVERIPSHEMQATHVNAMEVAMKAARDQGLDPADVTFMMQALEDTLGQDADTVLFRPGAMNERGEPIIYLWEDGKRVALRLADGEFGKAMYESITGLGQEWAGLWLNMLSLPTQLLRGGVTLDPAFAGANYFRDQLSAWILTEDHGGLLPNVIGGARGTYIATRDLFGASTDIDLYNSFGGIMGGEGTAGIHEARVKRDVEKLGRKGITVKEFNPLNKQFWKATGLTETGTRVSVFRNAMARAKADGLSDYEAMVEAAYSANDMIDFGRHGSQMLVARRLVTFLNAALQGLDRTARTFSGKTENVRAIRDAISPYIKQQSGQPLTVMERKNVGVAAKAYGKFVAVSMIGAALAMLYLDDEEYEEMPEYFRDTHWLFKVEGQWYRIPKPFELGVGSLIVERMIEAQLKGDEKAYERMMRGAAGLAIPPSSIPGMTLAVEIATNKKFGIGETATTAFLKEMTGGKVNRRDLVPDHMLNFPPEMQYNAYTSEFSKNLAQWTGISAIKWDHLITGLGGSLARTGLDLSNRVIPSNVPRAELSSEQQIFVRRFTVNPARSSQSKQEFWNLMGRSTGEYKGAAAGLKVLYDQGRENAIEADAYLKSLSDNARAYAILDLYGSADEKRLHPLNRAYAVLQVTNGIRREIATGEMKRADGTLYSPRERRLIQEAFEQLQMREARNALVAIGEPGFGHMKTLPVEPSMKELEALVPDAYSEMQYRLTQTKIQPFEIVQGMWLEMKQQLLDPDYRLTRVPSRKRGRQSDQ